MSVPTNATRLAAVLIAADFDADAAALHEQAWIAERNAAYIRSRFGLDDVDDQAAGMELAERLRGWDALRWVSP